LKLKLGVIDMKQSFFVNDNQLENWICATKSVKENYGFVKKL